jgi:nucleolar protein 58
LLNLAKQPGSTVQILGAEKALFRALKTKHATPKYGLLYHASLVGQAPPKMKGKMSRSLAAKAALTIRYDALGDGQDDSMGLENRLKVCYRSLPIGTMATSSFLLQLLFWEDNFDTVICSLKHD